MIKLAILIIFITIIIIIMAVTKYIFTPLLILGLGIYLYFIFFGKKKSKDINSESLNTSASPENTNIDETVEEDLMDPYNKEEIQKDVESFSSYRGSIDTELPGENSKFGVSDLSVKDYTNTIPGNKYNDTRNSTYTSPHAAIDEEIDHIPDSDERIFNAQRWRGQRQENAWNGVFRRSKYVDSLYREELDKTENRDWRAAWENY